MCLSLMGRGAQTLLGRTKRKQPANADCFWQGRRDSNTQPTVLETATLPLSHSPKQRSHYITKKGICQLFFSRMNTEFLNFPEKDV